jgi:hypothetical protein
MNTNNRIVWLQQHVVLLTVMEHAEDLIYKKKLKNLKLWWLRLILTQKDIVLNFSFLIII